MKTELTNTDQRQGWNPRKSQLAFSLIELIGVLAVIAILAAVMVPALIRQMDRIAGQQESAALKSFGDALQQSIMRARSIPTYTNWASTVASELGVDISYVTNSPRRQPRFFLIDPALRVGNNSSGLPYTQSTWVNQTNSGSVVTNSSGVLVPPLSPRVMVLSSIGSVVPAGITNGVPSSTNFNAIWDWNDASGTVPSAPAFAGWTGSGDDLKIQRVNLSPLFVRLILTTNVSESGYYSIDSTSTNYIVRNQGVDVRDSYFIRNSVLYLYYVRTNIDSQQILTRDTSFVYEQNVWRSSLTGGSFLAGSLDLGSIVDKYLDSPENTNAANTTVTNSIRYTGISQQSVVVSNMNAYLKAYTNWAYAGFPNNSLKTTANDIQANLVTAVQNQYTSVGGENYIPAQTDCPP